MPQFFLIVPPGFETSAETELLEWLKGFRLEPIPEITREKGGLSIEIPLEIGFALNGKLKIPSRILLRLADFGCRDFPKLFKKIRNFDWQPWTLEGAPMPEFVVSSHASRLALKKRIVSTCEDGFKAWRKLHGYPEKPEAAGNYMVHVRIVDDVCWVSLDTSGEHLHKRGYKTKTTEAPLRENIAAGLLRNLLAHVSGPITLIDPMAGSGTFLSEAAFLGKALDREFAYQKFKCVVDGSVVVPTGLSQLDAWPQPEKLFAFDIDEDAVAAGLKNFHDAGFSGNVSFKRADIFEDEYSVPGGTRIVISNPPYGERIKIEGPLTTHYSKLMHMIDQKLKPVRVGLLLPEKANLKAIRLPENWQVTSRMQFANGGLSVVFYTFTCASQR